MSGVETNGTIRKITEVRSEYLSARGIHANLERRARGGRNVPPPGYLPPEIDYTTAAGDRPTIRVRDYDVRFLDRVSSETALNHLALIHRARRGDAAAAEELRRRTKDLFGRIAARFAEPSLVRNNLVIPYTAEGEYSELLISQKGRILFDLSRRGFSTADFCVLSSEAYHLSREGRQRHLLEAVHNLEILTGRKLESSDDPLLIAVRSALPEYLPGFMPTYLNVGLIPSVFDGLPRRYGEDAAGLIRLNNRKTILEALDPEAFASMEKDLGPAMNRARTLELAEMIERLIDRQAPQLLTSAIEQLKFFQEKVYVYYEQRLAALRNFMTKDTYFPALILQRMVCTVIDEHSYPGVLYSRHPRKGQGVFMLFARKVFGEDLMTGLLQPEERHFLDREEAREEFPAIYHFWDRLSQLEDIFQGPVIVEFSGVHGTFTILQVNAAELSGAGMLTAVMNLHRAGRIGQKRVRDLIKPYHVRQIESDAIDPKSLEVLPRFARGLSVLPRAAVSGRVYFSADQARRAKTERPRENVVLVKERFTPQDAVDLPIVSGICSLSPAAIHVVTAAQNLGIPSLLNLEGAEVRIDRENREMKNREGRVVREGDWVTISSRWRSLFLGKAVYAPARLLRFMAGENVELTPADRPRFEQLARDYAAYRTILESVGAAEFGSLQDLGHALRYGRLRHNTRAAEFINRSFDLNEPRLIERLLEVTLGTHLINLAAFEKLSPNRQIRLLRAALALCRDRGISGYEAGSFVIGGFVRPEWPGSFWRNFGPDEIIQLINEWLLHQKYLTLMDEVDERRIRLIRDQILSQGLPQLRIQPVMVRGFMSLKLTGISLSADVDGRFDPQTAEVVACLGRPYGEFFDFSDARSLGVLRRFCDAEGRPLPKPEDR
ncbi:MAG: hypothetical protein NTW38_07250 [Candidatus Aminicenantes bacterium]|nr:hypothetical protein [Candidatus Aminicenantes bacterium]